jgi:hypothetical protein
MATPLRGVLRDIPARAGGVRCGGRVRAQPWSGQPERGGGRSRPDGDGDRAVHGRSLRRAPQPSGERCVRLAARLSVAPGARVPPGAARRGRRGVLVPVGRARQARRTRSNRARKRGPRVAGDADRARPDCRARQHDPGDRVPCAERRRTVRTRRRRLHRARGSLVEPDQRRLDEPGARSARTSCYWTSRTSGSTSSARLRARRSPC